MLATIPVFMALAEIIFLRTQRLTFRLALALLIGIAGVAVLVSRSLNLGGAPIDSHRRPRAISSPPSTGPSPPCSPANSRCPNPRS